MNFKKIIKIILIIVVLHIIKYATSPNRTNTEVTLRSNDIVPSSISAMDQAERLEKNGKPQEALIIYESELNQEPNNKTVLYKVIKLNLDSFNYIKADNILTTYSKALKDEENLNGETEDVMSKNALFYKLQGLYHLHRADHITEIVKNKERIEIDYERMLSKQRAIISFEASFRCNQKMKMLNILLVLSNTVKKTFKSV